LPPKKNLKSSNPKGSLLRQRRTGARPYKFWAKSVRIFSNAHRRVGHHRKILFSLREKRIRRAQNEKRKEYFSVVWRAERAVAGLASLVGVLLKESSNISQKTPPIGILQTRKLNLAARSAPLG